MEFMNSLFAYIKDWQISGWMLIAVTIIVMAICFLLPIKKLNEWAKDHIPLLLIGSFMLYAAVDMATSIATKAGF